MSDNNQRIQANQLAADTGAIVRTMMLASAEYEFLRLTAIRSVMAGGMSNGAICSAVDYLADGGYLEVRTAAERRPARVADVPMESLEIKLTHKGKQLAYGKLDDPLVDM